ncbi:unnamed protein product [Calypogeia fissa]
MKALPLPPAPAMTGSEAAAKATAAPSSSVEASAALCEHVQRQGLQCHLFSDITLSFCLKEYQLHRIILSQSSYFHSLLSGPWKEHGKSRIDLQIDDPNVTPEGLEIAFSYMYGVSPVFSGANVVAVLAAGCFLCLENLCDKCVQFIVEDLKVETFLGYQQISERHCYGRFADAIRNACWTFLCTHASGDLLHILPKFSLQVLCLLLKSDELWVLSESDRYRLSKQALIDWKLARVKSTSDSSDCINQKRPRLKPSSARKKARNAHLAGTRVKNHTQKAARMSFKQRAGRRKELTVVAADEEEPASPSREEEIETDLRRLQRLWEADDPTDRNKEESFQLVADLFTGGGIIYAHMEADEVLQAKKELEDAGLPTDAANDSIWQHVLLKSRVLKCRDNHNLPDDSSDDEDDDEMDDDEDDDDYDEVDDEDDDESSDGDSSDSDGWSTDHSSQAEADDESNSSDAVAGVSGQGSKRLKTQSTSLVCFSYSDSVGLGDTLGCGDGKRRRTTGGFSWAVKPDVGMQLSDFPPFRFGVEFVLKDKRWTTCVDLKSREVFYGGSMWKIVGSNLNQEKEDWVFGVQCRPLDTWEPHTYQDNRKKVPFMAKLYVKTSQGLRCVTGTAVRKMQHHSSQMRHSVSIHLSRKDLVENEPLRISTVVQLIDD